MADDTIREQIIQDICAAAAQIRTSDFYNTEIGQYVSRAELRIQSANLPAVSVFPGVEIVERISGKVICTMTLRLQAFSLYDMDIGNASMVQEQMLGDLIARMTKTTENVSSLIDSIQYVSGGPEEYPEHDEPVASTTATFEVKYKFLTGNPYKQ